MDMIVELVLPSLVLPLALSALMLVWSLRDPGITWVLPIIWLPSSFWLLGFPDPFPPQEASQWLWVLVLISTIINVSLTGQIRRAGYFQSGLLASAILIMSSPVLNAAPGWEFSAELLALAGVAGLVLVNTARGKAPATPSLILSVCAGGLAMVASLGGSVLVGQLSGALASSLGTFALYEIYSRFMRSRTMAVQINPMLALYFALLLIARVYAEIPLFSAAMLLVAPVPLISRHRYHVIGSLVAVGISLAWLLMTSDSSSYY